MARPIFPEVISPSKRLLPASPLPEILFITSYPPRECGIATYTQDLVKALENKFSNSFSLKICALEAGNMHHTYPEEVKYVLDTSDANQFTALAGSINADRNISSVIIQHEFGLVNQAGEEVFLQFLYRLAKPVIIVFHTVLPHPDTGLKTNTQRIAAAADAVIVMTGNAADILHEQYGVAREKLEVIPHGTHLVPHLDKNTLKEKYGLHGRKIMSTFGLLSSGKSIETTLDALPAIVAEHPDIMFLVIGKTHPGVVKSEGERYRNMLEEKVAALQLGEHVKFINKYLRLDDLLEYLQLTDVYLFTSKDPNQAVSGTFSYAMSCGCAVVSTPIPHAKEMLDENKSIFIDFRNSEQLAEGVNRLMGDDELRMEFSTAMLQRIVPTAWENSAIAHANLIQQVSQRLQPDNNDHKTYIQRPREVNLEYRIPEIKLDHLKKMTTELGMIQFCKINQPDISSGYTLDDNARAMIAVCMHYELTRDKEDLPYIRKYLDFIAHCQQPAGDFLNYVDDDRSFTPQNGETSLSDANGRALWALGFLLSKGTLMPKEFVEMAETMVQRAVPHIETLYSCRSIAFSIKGLYYCNPGKKSPRYSALINSLANRLARMYRKEAEDKWQWFEGCLTYGNSILPEAMLCAWLATGDPVYRSIARSSFDFLLSMTFNEQGIKAISNKTWMQKGQAAHPYGEQPIDIAYTILALDKFYRTFREPEYAEKMKIAFNWFLGQNHLHYIIYNPCTGGCYDGLEETHVNLNQGAESTVSYLMARFTMEKAPYLTAGRQHD